MAAIEGELASREVVIEREKERPTHYPASRLAKHRYTIVILVSNTVTCLSSVVVLKLIVSLLKDLSSHPSHVLVFDLGKGDCLFARLPLRLSLTPQLLAVDMASKERRLVA